MCSQPCTAKISSAFFTAGSIPKRIASAASLLEAEPIRLPTASLVEQPSTISAPGLGFAACSRISMAWAACCCISLKFILITLLSRLLYHEYDILSVWI